MCWIVCKQYLLTYVEKIKLILDKHWKLDISFHFQIFGFWQRYDVNCIFIQSRHLHSVECSVWNKHCYVGSVAAICFCENELWKLDQSSQWFPDHVAVSKLPGSDGRQTLYHAGKSTTYHVIAYWILLLFSWPIIVNVFE